MSSGSGTRDPSIEEEDIYLKVGHFCGKTDRQTDIVVYREVTLPKKEIGYIIYTYVVIVKYCFSFLIFSCGFCKHTAWPAL